MTSRLSANTCWSKHSRVRLNPFQVQVRFEALPGSELVSVTTRMAVDVNGTTIELDALGPDALLLTGSDGVTAPASAAELSLGVVDVDGDGTGDIFIDGDLYTIVLNDEGEQLQVKVMDGSLNICVFLANTTNGNQGNVRGLMGDADGTGDVSDDLALRAGTEVPAGTGLVDLAGAAVPEGTPLTADTALPQPLDFDTLYGIYADSWRLDGTTGKGPLFSNTVTFPDNFPAGVLTVDDLPQSLRDAAEAAALAAGLDPNDPVDPTPQDVFDAAVLDFALTGNEDFFEGAAGIVAEPTTNVEPDNAPVLDLVVGVTNAAPGVVLTEGDSGTQAASFSFYRIGDTTSDLVITYDIGGDVDDDDLVGSIGAAPDPVTILAGESSADVVIEFTGDVLTEDDEDITLTITSIDDPAALIGAPAASVTIVTDDFPPNASDDAFTTDEDTAVSGNLILGDNGNGVDDDPDGDTLTLVSITDSAGTTTAISGSTTVVLASGAELTVDGTGAFTFDPSVAGSEFQGLDLDEVGEETFTYTISDGNEGTGTGSVTVGLTGLNDAPVAVADRFTGTEDLLITGNLLQGSGSPDVDPEGGVLLVTSLTVEGTTQTVAPGGDATFMLTSGAELTVNAVGDITLDAAGSFDALAEQPMHRAAMTRAWMGISAAITLAPTQVTLPGSGSFNLLAGQAGTPRDIDYLTITIPVGSQLDSFILNDYVENRTDGGAFLGIGAGSNLPGTPGNQGAGDLIGGLLFDETEIGLDLLALSNGGSGTGGFTQPLAAGDYTFWFNQLGGTVNTFDATFTTSLVGAPSGPPTQERVDFSYTIADVAGVTDSAASAFVVEGVNDAPEAADDDGFEVAFQQSTTIAAADLLANDTDAEGDDLVIVLGTATGGGVSLDASGDVVFDAAPGFFGEASFTYQAQDTSGALSNEATVTVTVPEPVNTAPAPTDDVFETDQNTAIMGNLITDDNGNGADFDAESNTLTVVSVTGPNGEDFQLTNGNTVTAADGTDLGVVSVGTDGAFFFEPDAGLVDLNLGEEASFSLTVEITDGLETVSSTVDVTIDGLNDAPVAVDDDLGFVEFDGNPVVFDPRQVLSNDFDVDGDELVFLQVGNASVGSVSLVGSGNIEFELPAGFVGEASFTYSVADASGARSNEATAVFEVVAPENTPPEITSPDAFSVVEEQPFSATVTAVDAEDDDITFEISLAARTKTCSS